MVHLKYLWIILGRNIRNLLHKLPIICSYFFLMLSVMPCLIIMVMTLFPNYFDKMPVLSYYISEQEFPITYTLNGTVKVLDASGNIINKNIEVFVGGYSTFLKSEHFNLVFTSPKTDKVYIVIQYEVNGHLCEYTTFLKIKDSNHSIFKEFIIYA